jgi:hypothetical protein
MIKTIKEKHLDQLFSLLVRGRTNGYCEFCKRNDRQAQCSHLFGRRSRNTRFCPINAATHCAVCHRWLGENPLEFGEWMVRHLGHDAVEDLRLRAHTTRKRSQPEMRDLYNEMKSELSRMEAMRAEGFTGRIEFTLEN